MPYILTNKMLVEALGGENESVHWQPSKFTQHTWLILYLSILVLCYFLAWLY